MGVVLRTPVRRGAGLGLPRWSGGRATAKDEVGDGAEQAVAELVRALQAFVAVRRAFFLLYLYAPFGLLMGWALLTAAPTAGIAMLGVTAVLVAVGHALQRRSWRLQRRCLALARTHAGVPSDLPAPMEGARR